MILKKTHPINIIQESTVLTSFTCMLSSRKKYSRKVTQKSHQTVNKVKSL